MSDLNLVKFILLFFVSVFETINCCNAQVTITEIKKTIKTEFPRPSVYDSTLNFEYYSPQNNEKDSINEIAYYKQYFGLTVYCPPSTYKDSSSFIYGYASAVFLNRKAMIINPNNRYFTIIGFISRDSFLSLVNGSELYDRLSDYMYVGAFILKDNLFGDTIIEVNSMKNYLILVPFFIKQKKMFDGKKFVFESKESWNSDSKNKYMVRDLISNSKIYLKDGSKWQCEVTLMDYNKAMSTDSIIHYNTWDQRYKIAYLFRNDSQTIVLFKEHFSHLSEENYYGINIVPNYSIDRGDWGYNRFSFRFILESEFIEKEKKKNLSEQEKENLRQKQKQAIKRQAEDHLKICIERYGQVNGKLISEGKITLGMSLEMCQMAWGDPISFSKTTVEDGVYQINYYMRGYALYFIDGILVRIDE